MEISIIGSAVPGILANACGGKIHSVFSHAVNLRIFLAGGLPPCHITVMGKDAHPYGMTCPALRGPCGAPGFDASDELHILDGMICTGDRGFVFARAKTWGQPQSANAATSVNLKILEDALNRHLRKQLLSGSAGADWGNLERRFKKAFVIQQGKPAHLLADKPTAALSALIGYGPGLTPAGDDFVSGWLVYKVLTSPSAHRAQYCNWSRRLAEEDTTCFSKTQIQYAGQGCCLQSIFNMIKSLGNGDLTQQQINTVLNLGATSGWAWAMGVLAAAKGGFNAEN